MRSLLISMLTSFQNDQHMPLVCLAVSGWICTNTVATKPHGWSPLLPLRIVVFEVSLFWGYLRFWTNSNQIVAYKSHDIPLYPHRIPRYSHDIPIRIICAARFRCSSYCPRLQQISCSIRSRVGLQASMRWSNLSVRWIPERPRHGRWKMRSRWNFS